MPAYATLPPYGVSDSIYALLVSPHRDNLSSSSGPANVKDGRGRLSAYVDIFGIFWTGGFF